MASSATSLHFLSLAPQSPLSLNKTGGAASAAVHLNPLPPTARLCLSAAAFFSISPREGFSSILSRRVAVASDLDQLAVLGEDEDEASASDEEEVEERVASYSPDQKFFVGNLPFNVDSAALAELFGSVGCVEMCEVIYDKMTGRSRGFGFVTMASAQEANAAVQQFNGYELEGRAMRVNNDPPPPREDREGGFRGGREGGFRGGREGGYNRGGEGGGYRGGESSYRGGGGGGGGGMRSSEGNRCYVGNLAWSVDNSSLESLFSEQGRVVEAKVVYDRESGRSRGFGFVTYSSVDEANKACNSLDGADLGGRSIRVNIAESRPPRREY